MIIDENTRISEINDAAVFRLAKDAFIAGGDFFRGEKAKISLKELQNEHPTWNSKDIIFGLNRLRELSLSGTKYVHSVYSENEIAEDGRKAQVKLFYLPAEDKTSDFFVLLLAGGSYGAVCTMVEALPTAAELNSLGISCFCLNYRTAVQEDFSDGLFPKPLEDISAACKYVKDNAKMLGVSDKKCVFCGFSAGAHLAALWGSLAENFGCSAPKALVLAYPLVSMKRVPEGKLKQYMLAGMFGAQNTAEDIRKYDAAELVSAGYPPAYIVKARDDDTVPREDAELFAACLRDKNIPVGLEIGAYGGHGFGLGTASALNGWVGRAAAWINSIVNR